MISENTFGDVGLRSPDEVMKLERLGSGFPTRLSFLRSLLRRMSSENWQIRKSQFDLDEQGYGTAVYSLETPRRSYSLIAFSQHLDSCERTDRVIARAWDAAFVLFDGQPTTADIKRLSEEAPCQEAGRYLPSDLVLSRANRSVRVFDHVVNALASGSQPGRYELRKIGYLMRTTAVYANGKFGLADRSRYAERPELAGPFQAEMLSVYLIRCFTFDLVEHIARARGGIRALKFDKDLKRYLGIGNATGLGMAPFLVSHPSLIHNWFYAREEALARVRNVVRPKPERIRHFSRILGRARDHAGEWIVEDEMQTDRIIRLRDEMDELQTWLEKASYQERPWNFIFERAVERFSLEGQELVISLLFEPNSDLVDNLQDCLSVEENSPIDASMTIKELWILIEENYKWAFNFDFKKPRDNYYFWYYSAEKLEPRRGKQNGTIATEQAMEIAVARDIQYLYTALQGINSDDQALGVFLIANPSLRQIAKRVQITAKRSYAELRGNLIGDRCRPIDILRAKLAYFGASRFDPKSDLWTRVTLFQGAPLHDELETPLEWCFPFLPG